MATHGRIPLQEPGEDEHYVSDINVTPLVDVFLVLLLIFMVTAPMLGTGLDVELPEVNTAAPKHSGALIVSIGAEGTMAVGDVVSSLDEILSAATEADEGVYIRADVDVPWGLAISVLDALRTAGVRNVSLLTTPLPPEQDQ